MTRIRSLLLALSAAVYAPAAEPPFPESMAVLRGQPSVFMVVAKFDVILDTPRHVQFDADALKADLGTVKLTGRDPVTDADRTWALLGGDPGKYLRPTQESIRQTFENVRTTTGTAFAVSLEGILLTNAHLVNDKAAAELGDENWVLIEPRVQKDLDELEKNFGPSRRPLEERLAIGRSITRWYASRSTLVQAKFRSASVILDYKVDIEKRAAAVKKDGVAAALAKPADAEEMIVPTTVLACGETMPGKDVAVLKATFEPAEQAKLVKISKERVLAPGTLEAWLAAIQNDRLICLPLGNSDDVMPAAKVQALGLPGSAFNPQLMDADARYKVSARAGQISQIKRLKGSGGWDAFEMTAAIDPGDSGGPVLDAEGRVIAINMGFAGDRTNPLRLAVPVKVAKEFLAKAGVKPDPGPLAARWEQALRQYAAGKYEECWGELKTVRHLQEGAPLSGRGQASWYVKDLGGRCLQKLGKVP